MTGHDTRWFRIAARDAFPLREGRAIEVASRQLAIFNLGDRFVAVENKCPHKSGPLADGIISGTTVVCPLHAWKFDLVAGGSVNHAESGACLKLFSVRIEDGIVAVNLPIETEEESESPSREVPDRPLRWVARKPLTATAPLQTKQ
jgi:nitrite reductase (NADH) small subunit